MSQRRTIWLFVAITIALIVGFLTRSDPPTPTPNLPGTFSFGALGDAPYYFWEDLQYPLLLKALDAQDLRWILHVGDIFWHPCTDSLYRKSLDRWARLRHPVIYTPGDNEWADCWEPGSGHFAPRERLERIRSIFFSDPTRSLGGSTLSLLSQGRREPISEFVENVRWAHGGLRFATIHLVGSRNGLEPFAGRTAADDDAVKRRTEAAAAWVRETFAEARASGDSAVVLGFHGNPDFEEPVGHKYRRAFEPFLAVLEEEVERFQKPVLAMHGDGHEYIVDHPLARRTISRLLENFTRLQVPGSPEVGWVRVVVTPGAAAPFAFEKHVIPCWKYW